MKQITDSDLGPVPEGSLLSPTAQTHSGPDAVELPAKGKANRKQIGQLGETLAAEYLQNKHWHIKERNWRCRSGELDIIAEDGDTLVFVEVRTRRNTGMFGSPQESVNWRKQQQVRQTAVAYLYRIGMPNRTIRFDLVSVLLSTSEDFISLDHLEHAF